MKSGRNIFTIKIRVFADRTRPLVRSYGQVRERFIAFRTILYVRGHQLPRMFEGTHIRNLDIEIQSTYFFNTQ